MVPTAPPLTSLLADTDTPLQLLPKSPGVLRVIIYARISKLHKGRNSTNTTIQVNECLRELKHVAEDRGVTLVIVAIFKEDDRSASKYSKKPRPKWLRLVELVEGNWADMVAGTEMERLTRRPNEANPLIELAETRDLREILLTSDDSLDLSTADGIYRARQAVNLAERESNKLSQRGRRKQAERAREGYSHGSRRAFGFKPGNMELDKAGKEYEGLRQAGQLRMNGFSHKELAYWFNENGYLTTEGKAFIPLTVRNMLRRLRYAPWPGDPTCAIREHKGKQYKARWEPVWTPAEWEQLQLIDKLGAEKYRNRPRAKKYLLTGLLYCGKCGRSLNGETKRDHPGRPLRRTYQCRVQGDTERRGGCGGVSRNADALEDFVLDCLFYRLDTQALGELVADDAPDDAALRERLDRRSLLSNRLTDILDDYATGVLSRDEMAHTKTRTTQELDLLEREIEDLSRARTAAGLVRLPVGQSLRETWEVTASASWRREILALVIERILVKPGITKPYYKGRWRFDPNLIEIVWRV